MFLFHNPLTARLLAKYKIYIYIYIYTNCPNTVAYIYIYIFEAWIPSILIIPVMFIYIFIGCPLTWDR